MRQPDDAGAGPRKFLANEQLLFGIIALQSNFLTREQLVAAFDAWVHDKSRSLANVLEQQGVLTYDDRAALQNLVSRFLKKHGGDPEQSLAALSPVPQIRPDLENFRDADVQASLGHLGQPLPDDPYATSTLPYAEPAGLGRFRILRPHARGGLGQVSIALDQELNREVALKEIQPRHADDQVSRERFVLEAEITGGLEHPGIVPVYGLGQAADGRPFYAMRFVKGDSLKQAIETFHKPDNPIRKDPGARQLALRQLLGRFIDVCYAMEYAHSRGVLHRDLKPGNIMVGMYGETLVVDWGLAKAQGKQDSSSAEASLRPSSALSSSGQTQPGSAVGTPSYMSPEQAAGRLDQIGPASDVYSLGATLYHVLCGQPPFEKEELAEILAKVQRGEFPKPRSVVAEIPRGLEAICLKAMSLKPADRYVSARSLADDLEHWLADEPLGALHDTLGDRVTRLGRRHKGAVRAAVVALVLLALVSTVAALLIDEQRREKSTLADEKGELADRNARLASDMTLLAQEKSDLADSEREAREKAMVALRTMTDDIIEKQMARGTTLTDENREYLQTIIRQFEDFAAITRDDATSRSIRAEGYSRVARMRYKLGELHAAEAAYIEALAIQTKLSADFPTRPEFRLRLGASHNNLGLLFKDTGRLKEAEKAWTEAVAIRKQLAADFPADPDIRNELAESHNNLGTLLETGRRKEAEAAYTEALAIHKQLAADFPNRAEFRQGVARSQHNLGSLLQSTGRLKDAETAYTEALAIQRQLVADFPTVTEYRLELATSHNNLGFLLKNAGRIQDAETAYTGALAIQRQLVDNFPTRPDFRKGLAMCHNNLGLLFKDTGRLKDAEMAHTEALAIQTQLTADFPTRPDLRRDLAKSHNNLGILFTTTGRIQDAETAFTEALAIQKQLAAEFPTLPEFRWDVARSHFNLGVLLQNTGRLQDAETAYTDALAIKKQLAADFPAVPDVRQELAANHNNLGIVLQNIGRLQEAETAFSEALAIKKQLAADFADQSDFQNDVAGALVVLGGLCNLRRDFQRAKSLLEGALPHHQAALLANAQNPIYREFFGLNLVALVQACAGLQDQVTALDAAKKLRDLDWAPPTNAYNAACALALCVPIVREDQQLDAAQRDSAVQFYADEAMKMLHAAVDKGMKDAAHIAKDTDLDPIRDREDFQKLIEGLKKPE